MDDQGDFREFVGARSPELLRLGFLLTGDWFASQDLVQVALARCWVKWQHVETANNPYAYVRRIVINSHRTGCRRGWRNELPTATPPETAYDEQFDLDLQITMRAALRCLTRRQRAVIALRFFEDLTEQQTADVLSCSVGTVKSTGATALARLREQPEIVALDAKEAHHEPS